MEPNDKLSRIKGVLLEDCTRYRRLIEHLLYLTITRPDLAYYMQVLSQFMDDTRQSNLDTTH